MIASARNAKDFSVAMAANSRTVTVIDEEGRSCKTKTHLNERKSFSMPMPELATDQNEFSTANDSNLAEVAIITNQVSLEAERDTSEVAVKEPPGRVTKNNSSEFGNVGNENYSQEEKKFREAIAVLDNAIETSVVLPVATTDVNEPSQTSSLDASEDKNSEADTTDSSRDLAGRGLGLNVRQQSKAATAAGLRRSTVAGIAVVYARLKLKVHRMQSTGNRRKSLDVEERLSPPPDEDRSAC